MTKNEKIIFEEVLEEEHSHEIDEINSQFRAFYYHYQRQLYEIDKEVRDEEETVYTISKQILQFDDRDKKQWLETLDQDPNNKRFNILHLLRSN